MPAQNLTDGPGDANPERAAERDPAYVQVLEKALRVIKVFNHDAPSMSLSDVAKRTGLTRAGARRILLTLERLGYAGRAGRQFSLRPRVLDLGFAYLSSIRWTEAALPYMEAFVKEVQESCSATVLDDCDIVYVARVPTRRLMTVELNVGARLPAYATAMGRVLLAGLAPAELDAFIATVKLEPLTPHTVTSRARLRAIVAAADKDGWCAVDQELEVGLRSIAVPIRDRGGRAFAAVNMSSHASRSTIEDLVRGPLPLLMRTARQIEASVAFR
jgi:IclR family pca regulon transcriptional regulator